jgi:N utilization substance protein B
MSHAASRQASRQVALQVLYAADLAPPCRSEEEAEQPMPPAAEEVFESVAESFELPEGARAFATQLVWGVLQRRDELDALLAQYARNWRISRMAAVDRNILRIAAYELLRTDTPTSVILDQAIELAHRFGDEPSPAFVNGVLDAVAHAVERSASSAGVRARGEEPE